MGNIIGESSRAVGLIPGGIVIQGERTPTSAGEAKGLVVRNLAVLIFSALNPNLAALLWAMLPLIAFSDASLELMV